MQWYTVFASTRNPIAKREVYVMCRKLCQACLLVTLVAIAISPPVSAGVRVNVIVNDCRYGLPAWNPYVYQPAYGYCSPWRVIYTIPPAYPPRPWRGTNNLYVPPAAYLGQVYGPPLVVTDPPTMYGHGSLIPTNATVSDPARAFMWSEGKLETEILHGDRVQLTWFPRGYGVACVTFHTGDINRKPLETRNITRSPYTATLTLNNRVKYVGVSVYGTDGSLTTRWVPYAEAER